MCNGCFFKFGVEVGVEVSIVNALYRLRITDQLFKSYAFTRVVRSQSTLQRLLRRQILKNTLYFGPKNQIKLLISKISKFNVVNKIISSARKTSEK
jgi:hypothetical protein